MFQTNNTNSILGIDFGLSNSVACLLKNGETEVVCENKNPNRCCFPSFVEYNGNEVLIGSVAKKRRVYGLSKYCVCSVKRLIGLKWDEYERIENKDMFGCEVVCGVDGYPRLIDQMMVVK